jgi:KDO2-lipid IV(A) lauroyltransferase
MKRLKQTITFCLLFPWLFLIAAMPYWVIYIISDLAFYLIYYVIQYRRKIVWKNLTHAFPEKNEAELRKLEKNFYKHLCDLLVEHIKSLTISRTQIAQRCVLENPEVLENLYQTGRHILLVTGHLGNWEWAANAVTLQTNYRLCALYKPLSNPYFDSLVRFIRKRFNKQIIPEGQALRKMLNYGSIPMATAILADQAPLPQHAYIMQFLNQPTYVTQGVEKLAKKLNQPVVYIHIKKERRGHYKVEAELLVDHPRETSLHLITQTYIHKLERDIHLQPAIWLWSHNRWKNKIRLNENKLVP